MEIWKDTEYFNYQISNFGNLRNKTTKQIRKLNIGNGYYKCTLSTGKRGNTKTIYIHRLVAQAFLDCQGEDLQVNHIDGNKLNNKIENLEWCTPQENQLHAKKLGLTKSGEIHKWAKLTLENVEFIRTSVLSNVELAKIYNVDKTTISKIRNFHSWK